MISQKYIELFKDDNYVHELVKNIFDKGCIELTDFLEVETFDNLLDYARELGFNDVSIKRKSGTPLMDFSRSDEFMAILDAMHKARCKYEGVEYVPLDPMQQSVGFPQQNIEKGTAIENPLHFDASYINVTLALNIPPESEGGNLFIYPSLRRRIKPYVLATAVARFLRHFPILRKVVKPKEVTYKVGALNVFFGDITLHGVYKVTKGERLIMVINSSTIK